MFEKDGEEKTKSLMHKAEYERHTEEKGEFTWG